MQKLSFVQALRDRLGDRSRRRIWRVGLLSGLVLLGAACNADSDAAMPDAALRRHRDAGASTTSCIHCSMIVQIITQGGIGGGPDPCMGGGMGGPPGGFSFCNEPVFSAFTSCLQNKCAASCSFGGGMMCSADGGTLPPPDAGTAAADAGMSRDAGAPADAGSGVTCEVCVNTQCAAELGQCGADK
jgi:hypothetical protein